VNAVSADHAQKANDAKADETKKITVSERPSLNNRAPADEGKIRRDARDTSTVRFTY
jgi:hypothetical protein